MSELEALPSRTLERPTTLPGVRLGAYAAMLKNLQTGLLVITGLAGYMSARPSTGWLEALALVGSLFLAVGGSTVLNMVIDRDIDACMSRTADRPLPSGAISPARALAFGLTLAFLGTVWAGRLQPLYGVVVFAGLFFDVVVYSLWLKRRSPWSIVWGGIAGGMPVLAGRALATGRIDVTGLLLALAVLLWIPTHIMTFSIKYAGDYHAAGVPVFPNRYGVRVTRWIIAASTVSAAAVMLWAMVRIGLSASLLWPARGLGGALCAFTLLALLHPTPRLNFVLYKLASLYMLGSMIILIAGA